MPTDIDVILVAPKGSGRTVRSLFKAGKGINGSFAVWQDVTGQAKEKAIALGVAIGKTSSVCLIAILMHNAKVLVTYTKLLLRRKCTLIFTVNVDV